MRAVVRLWMGVAYIVAFALVLAGLGSFIGGSAEGGRVGVSVAAGVLSFLGAAVAVVLGHLGKEMAIMLADIADGVLHIAERQGSSTAAANQDW